MLAWQRSRSASSLWTSFLAIAFSPSRAADETTAERWSRAVHILLVLLLIDGAFSYVVSRWTTNSSLELFGARDAIGRTVIALDMGQRLGSQFGFFFGGAILAPFVVRAGMRTVEGSTIATAMVYATTLLLTPLLGIPGVISGPLFVHACARKNGFSKFQATALTIAWVSAIFLGIFIGPLLGVAIADHFV